jgi:hypothetical protein
MLTVIEKKNKSIRDEIQKYSDGVSNLNDLILGLQAIQTTRKEAKRASDDLKAILQGIITKAGNYHKSFDFMVEAFIDYDVEYSLPFDFLNSPNDYAILPLVKGNIELNLHVSWYKMPSGSQYEIVMYFT